MICLNVIIHDVCNHVIDVNTQITSSTVLLKMNILYNNGKINECSIHIDRINNINRKLIDE